jgi:hypothetical protein
MANGNDNDKRAPRFVRHVHTDGMGGYTVGAALTKPADLLGYFKMLCDAADVDYEGTPEAPITDEQLMAVIRANKDDSDTGEAAIVDAIGELSAEVLEDESQPVAVEASQRPAIATEVAQVLDQGDFNKTLDQEITHKVKARRGAIPVYFEVLSAFTKANKLELLDSLPVPGTPQTETVNGKVVTHNNYDRYETYRLVDGKKRKAVGSVYADIFDSTATGRALMADKLATQKILNDQPQHPQKVALQGKVRTIDQRRQYGLQVLRMAIKLRQSIVGMKELADNIRWTWIPAYGENVNNTTGAGITDGPEPIFLYGGSVITKEDGSQVFVQSSGDEAQRCSVQTFCRYDVAATLKAGGKYVNLVATQSRGASTTEGSMVKSLDDLRSVLNDVSSFIANREQRAGVLAILAKRDDETRDFAIALGDTYAFLSGIMGVGTTGNILYEKYKAEQQAATKAREAAAETAKTAETKAA